MRRGSRLAKQVAGRLAVHARVDPSPAHQRQQLVLRGSRDRALGESLAHLNYLLANGRLTRRLEADGRLRYRRR